MIHRYKLPGYISAGLTCDLHITFEPKLPIDINAILPLLAETGDIGAPAGSNRARVALRGLSCCRCMPR